MSERIITEETKKIHNEIKEEVFRLERDNFKQKSLNSNQVIQKIKKIVEGKVR